MPDLTSHTRHQLDGTLDRIRAAIYTVVAPLDICAWRTAEPVPYDQRTDGEELTLTPGDAWGSLFDCAWFRFTGQVPEGAAGRHVVLLLDVNGEMCVFDEDGVPVRGLTNVSSTFDLHLGRPGKRVLQMYDAARGGESVEVWADAGCNDLFGNLQDGGTVKQADIAICDDNVRDLYYDFEVLHDFLKILPEDTPRHQQILTGLLDVAHLVHDGVAGAASRARTVLAPLLAKKGGDPSLRISAVGHAHMDLAWLWPIRETIRKGARTFSTAIELLDRYPDYIFGASQPQYFLWMKQHYPDLYAKIKEKVAAGRIEPQGAMWVEADTNLSGGEALVRQLIEGKRFFLDEFDVDVRYLWLPDVFGYSGAMPQILARAEIDYFSTQKLSWSRINKFPHQSFHWQGIDGTRMLTHMLPEETYNGPAAPRSVHRIESNYSERGVSDRALMVFGIGDGGGGPGAEHLERLAHIRNLAGLSPVTQESAADFFEDWKKDAARFPTWVGELYLECHQGTLTTQARSKRYNRKLELLLRELEWKACLSGILNDAAYPTDRLQDIWREVLLYQFHDILPGSSIKRVYDESLERYEAMHEEVTDLVAETDRQLVAAIDTSGLRDPAVVHNSLSWERTEWLQVGRRWLHVTVPSMGHTAIDADSEVAVPSVVASADVLENDLLRVTFTADGSIISVYDKRLHRDVLSEGTAGNRLAVYDDPGDAWDFALDYADKPPRHMELVSAEPRVDGPRAVLEQTYRLGHSELVQEISLTAGSPRLDFVNRLRWRETGTMLRTSFPVAVHTDEAACDIQFGHIRRPTHRNTTWDLARDEVAAHKWVDLSQRDYGVALLNDCKYGHKIKDGVIDLNLLRSVPHTGPRLVSDDDVQPGEPHGAYTDQCDHLFTYSLYPHPGDHVDGDVIHTGYELNVPLRVTPTDAHAGSRPASASFLQIDVPGIVVEAVKKAEDSDRLIVRLYESEHQAARARVRFGFDVNAASEVSLMENEIAPLEIRDGAVEVDFRPFEIKTISVETAAGSSRPG